MHPPSRRTQKTMYVLNWKLERTLLETMTWCTTHYDDLVALSHTAQIIFCPELVALAAVAPLLPPSVARGGQHCSPFVTGRHTGSISAQSLAQLGCTYCIVGHAESRRDLCLNDELVASICSQLIMHRIIPLICLGEPERMRTDSQRYAYLAAQLEPLYTVLKTAQPVHDLSSPHLYLVYEPTWAIGASTPLNREERHKVGTWLAEWTTRLPHISIGILYGGSVVPSPDLQDHAPYDGYILGRSSLDMQTLKKLI